MAKELKVEERRESSADDIFFRGPAKPEPVKTEEEKPFVAEKPQEEPEKQSKTAISEKKQATKKPEGEKTFYAVPEGEKVGDGKRVGFTMPASLFKEWQEFENRTMVNRSRLICLACKQLIENYQK